MTNWLLLPSNSLMCESLIRPKEEQSMKQNGSLCSVIAGNLAEVTLATQTWFLTEDKERWCCANTAATTLTSNSNSLVIVSSSILPSVSAGVIIVIQSRTTNQKCFWSLPWGKSFYSCNSFIKGTFSITKHSKTLHSHDSWLDINNEDHLILH